MQQCPHSHSPNCTPISPLLLLLPCCRRFPTLAPLPQPAGAPTLLIAHFPTAVCRGCLHTTNCALWPSPNAARRTTGPALIFALSTRPPPHSFSAHIRTRRSEPKLTQGRVAHFAASCRPFTWAQLSSLSSLSAHIHRNTRTAHTHTKAVPVCPLQRVPHAKCHICWTSCAIVTEGALCCHLRAGLGNGGTPGIWGNGLNILYCIVIHRSRISLPTRCTSRPGPGDNGKAKAKSGVNTCNFRQ